MCFAATDAIPHGHSKHLLSKLRLLRVQVPDRLMVLIDGCDCFAVVHIDDDSVSVTSDILRPFYELVDEARSASLVVGGEWIDGKV